MDTGAQFSCIWSDVVDYLCAKGEQCPPFPARLLVFWQMGRKSESRRRSGSAFDLLHFTWVHEFKVLDRGPFPGILGLDFSQAHADECGYMYYDLWFWVCPPVLRDPCLPRDYKMTRSNFYDDLRERFPVSPFARSCNARIWIGLCWWANSQLCLPHPLACLNVLRMTSSYPTARPVRSPTYRCAPPKLQTFRHIVNELLEQGVIRPSKSQYATPAFLVPKSGGGFRLVVDYRKVNYKITFDSYPLPSVEQDFEQFASARVLSVLDLNSAYFEIPLTPRSRRITALSYLNLMDFPWESVWVAKP